MFKVTFSKSILWDITLSFLLYEIILRDEVVELGNPSTVAFSNISRSVDCKQ